ncbi:hypothetical protein [Campylobacter sp. 2018MI13]|uniref:hypothetical protein n=1 Tax=Campylobacter sp. 2018MI13 TaxID=2836737 RepID=UPI001BDA62BE|nr:hypothetical protein [Campylobacter sp. 2018MI13]MBT0882377.1 hypothetical protein [Campylobacter sp. 2018MI13]
MIKEKLEKDINTTEENIKKDSKDNKITTERIFNRIKQYGNLSLALGQILLLILIIDSAFNYGVVYIFTLQYPIELTFEQLLTFGFSNLSWFMLLIFMLYISTEFVWQIKNTKKDGKPLKYYDCIYFIIVLLIVYLSIFMIFYNNYEKQDICLFFVLFVALIILNLIVFFKANKSNINYIRPIILFVSVTIFALSKISISSLSGLGDYNTTIMVDKNSFIKDIVDIEDNKEKYTKNYHYKGDYIELKDVKVLSTLGDIAYVELCSENMEIGKTLDGCKKTIRVELIKKDIHIIRNGKKQNVTNTENGSNKTNNESKEQNEQDLEKSKENKKEESTTKNN